MKASHRRYSVCVLTLFIMCIAASGGALLTQAKADNTTRATPVKYDKLALLVGIDEYKYDEISDLKGTVNDIMNMKSLLVESFGFPDDEQHIRVVISEQATRQGIFDGLQYLIDHANEDAIVVFHYAGHGSQLRDVEGGDEADGWDETLVAHDSGHQDPNPNRDITDDEINGYLQRLTAITENVTFIFDSCHSGSAVRAAGAARRAPRDERAPPARATTRGAGDGGDEMRPAGAGWALISGSASDEYSHEYKEGGKTYGALTWNLAKRIREVGTDATYREVMDVVKARVNQQYPQQHPQLEGPGRDQFVFSDRSIQPEPVVLASPAAGGEITLRAGQVHGVTAGSIYDVYSPGTRSLEDAEDAIARIEIASVQVTTATAKVLEGEVTELASRAIEREHQWPDPVLRVHLEGVDASAPLQAVRDGLASLNHISLLDEAVGYNVLVREDESGEFIVTEAGDPTEIAPRVAVADADATAQVIKSLSGWARWFNILAIGNNRKSQLGIAFDVQPSAVKGAGRGVIDDRGIDLTVAVGDVYTVSVTNQSAQNIFLALLVMEDNGRVDLLYPYEGEEDIIGPGKTLSIPLKATLADTRDAARDVIKVFASTQPADFGILTQDAIRGTSRSEALNPLEQLLAHASSGTTRAAKRLNLDDWTTDERILEVRR